MTPTGCLTDAQKILGLMGRFHVSRKRLAASIGVSVPCFRGWLDGTGELPDGSLARAETFLRGLAGNPAYDEHFQALTRDQASAERAQRNARDHGHEVAVQACKPKSEESFYPKELSELADVIDNPRHAPADYPGHDKARSVAASGIPYQELTRRDGSSRVPFMRGDEAAK